MQQLIAKHLVQWIEKSKPFLEYDGEGNLIDSDEEEEEEENTDIAVKYPSFVSSLCISTYTYTYMYSLHPHRLTLL